MNNPLGLRPCCKILSVFGLLASGHSVASSINVSYGVLKQHVSYLDETLTLKPAGPSLSLSYDINDNWNVDVDYHHWQDDIILADLFSAEGDLTTWGASVSYYHDNWSYAFSYNDSQDETTMASIRRPDKRNRRDDTQAQSFGASVGYGWVSGHWFYNTSLGAQSSHWDSTTIEVHTPIPQSPPPPPSPNDNGQGNHQGNSNPPPEPRSETTTQVNSGDSTSMSASVSLARFWSLSEDRGILAGTMLSWNHMLSGESVLVSQSGRNVNPPPNTQPNRQQGNLAGNGGANFNRAGNVLSSSISGDDSYGQLSFYLSYDINASWSVDVDTGVDIGTDDNDQIWSVSIGYFF